MLHLNVHPQNPQRRLLEQAVDIMRRRDGICVYPTDTVYGMGATATNMQALNKIASLLERDKLRLFSFICNDFSQISTYAQVSNAVYKLLKRYLPGPFTFILPATSIVPKKICPKRKTIGIRFPDNVICQELVSLLGEPLANTSIRLEGPFRGDPDAIKPAVLNDVDVMLDCGQLSDPRGSTIIDCTDRVPVVVREGKGIWQG